MRSSRLICGQRYADDGSVRVRGVFLSTLRNPAKSGRWVMGMSGHAFRRSSRRCFGDFFDQRLWMVPSNRLRMAFSFDQSLKMDSENARAYAEG